MAQPWMRYVDGLIADPTPRPADQAPAQRSDGGDPPLAFTPEQQRLYDAALANPEATADHLRAAFAVAGFPVIANLDEIVAARDRGRGFAPGRTARWRQTAAPDDEGVSGVTSDDTPNPQDPGRPLTHYQESTFGQAMSGVNEGIAEGAGFPVDAMTWAMNLVPQGINAVAGTDIPTIDDPVLGSEWLRRNMDGWAIYPPTDDPSDQFWRRFGRSVGAASVPIGGAARTARGAAEGLLAAAGGGAAAATSQQLLPGNEAAEIVAEVVGSAGTSAAPLVLRRRQAQQAAERAVPTVDQLRREERELYRAAEGRRRNATPTKTRRLARAMGTTLREEGRAGPTGRISETIPRAREAMQLVRDYSGKTMTPTQAGAVRSVIAEGLTSKDPRERRVSSLLLDTFDMWAAPLAPEFAAARDLANRRLNAESLEQAGRRAVDQAGTFTGPKYADALRTQFHQLDRNDLVGRDRFIDDLTSAIRDVAAGTPASKTARAVGFFAPDNPGSALVRAAAPAALGTALGGPVVGGFSGVAAPFIGQAARSVANRLDVNNAARAELIARHGGALPSIPLWDPEAERLALAVLAGQAANRQASGDETAQAEAEPFDWRAYTQPRRSLFGGL